MRIHLLRWDPIGVADAPQAQDEYDGYISPLMHMLHRGDSADAITAWLTYVVEDRIGIRPEPDRERECARALSDWWATATADGSEWRA